MKEKKEKNIELSIKKHRITNWNQKQQILMQKTIFKMSDKESLTQNAEYDCLMFMWHYLISLLAARDVWLTPVDFFASLHPGLQILKNDEKRGLLKLIITKN